MADEFWRHTLPNGEVVFAASKDGYEGATSVKVDRLPKAFEDFVNGAWILNEAARDEAQKQAPVTQDILQQALAVIAKMEARLAAVERGVRP